MLTACRQCPNHQCISNPTMPAFVQSYSQSQARFMFVTTLGMDNFDTHLHIPGDQCLWNLHLPTIGRFIGMRQVKSCQLLRNKNHPDWRLSKLPEMESLQGEGRVFYTRLCKKADKWPTHHWPRLFYRLLQPPPCTVRQSGVPTHLPLSMPTLSASAEPIFKTDCANWWHAVKIWRRQRCHQLFKG